MLIKTLILGLSTALLGLVATVVPQVGALETDVGLDWLFGLRGPRSPPTDVVVVTIDRESSDRLGLPNTPRKWPRSLHARLVRELMDRGAGVIVFDVMFEEARDPAQDAAFAQAIGEAGNVVLFESLKREVTGTEAGNPLIVERRVPPIPKLAEAAAGLAPFPLPKVPIRVNEYWLFKSGAGDAPTLPVTALQFYARPFFPQLLQLLREAADQEGLSLAARSVVSDRDETAFAQRLRQLFLAHPGLAERLRIKLADRSAIPNPHARSVLASFLTACSGPASRHIDFYGPPRSILTVPYYQVLNQSLRGGGRPNEFSGKAVFVGFSERLQPEQKDGFYTVFSQPDGLDMSGVEIAATAFANLLEDRSVQPLAPALQFLVIVLWGIALGGLFLLPAAMLVPVAAALAAGYVGVAYYFFAQHGAWMPLTVPLLVQLPPALLGGLLWRYLDTRREREHIRTMFAHYLPAPVVEALSRETAGITAKGEVVHAICLSTDAEQYTTLSETLQPDVLHALLNRYYEILFEPVRRHGGVISDVVGDSMLAIWPSTTAQSSLRRQACQAALEIIGAVDAFNRQMPESRLPTRMGLHFGELVLGHVGAADHYEYRAVGDIVNAATRVEGLNKQLGTRVLASRETIEGLEDIVTRELGSFRLVGKTRPLVIHEVLAGAEQADAGMRERCVVFANGLQAFRAQRWQEAIADFEMLLAKYSDDGPSRYYLGLCEQYSREPPPAPWDGVINVGRK